MKISALLLCEKAVVREGMLYLLGGGAKMLIRPAVPAPLSIDLAVVLETDSVKDLTSPHVLQVSVRSDRGDGLALATINMQIGLPGEPPPILPSVPLAVPLQDVGVTSYGLYYVDVELDGEPAGSVDFLVDKEAPVGFAAELGGIQIPAS